MNANSNRSPEVQQITNNIPRWLSAFGTPIITIVIVSILYASVVLHYPKYIVVEVDVTTGNKIFGSENNRVIAESEIPKQYYSQVKIGDEIDLEVENSDNQLVVVMKARIEKKYEPNYNGTFRVRYSWIKKPSSNFFKKTYKVRGKIKVDDRPLFKIIIEETI